MKKLALSIVVLAVVALALTSVGTAYAQSPTQAPGSGYANMGGRGNRAGAAVGATASGLTPGSGLLHDYMLAGYSEALNIPVDTLQARLDAGETMSQIALSTGLTLDEFRTLMTDVRIQAIDAALADGVITQEQADWLKTRGAGQMSAGRGMQAGRGQFANPSCPNFTPAVP